MRECEWSNEAKLINSYHIPKKQVYIAKALNAHDSWDYEGEFKCLIQGGLKEQAKMALLHFLLPKTYDGKICLLILQWIIFIRTLSSLENDAALKKSIHFLSEMPGPEDDAEIKTLRDTYTALLDKDNMEHADRYIKELQQLQQKYKSQNLHTLLQGLIESLMDYM